MCAKIPLAMVLMGVLLCAKFAVAADDFPEYVDQDSAHNYVYSAIDTSDELPISDRLFAQLVSGAVPTNVASNELVFAFMQCYGGGMIDELDNTYTQFTYPPVSYTSACRGYEKSHGGTEDPASGGKSESYYNLHYSGRIGGAAPGYPPEANRARKAAQYAYNNDYWGPVAAAARGATPTEHPQYHANSQGVEPAYLSLADSNVLHRQSNDNPYKVNTFMAVLWGGSKDEPFNWNSLDRIHTDLVARGYTESEMYITYPGGPGGGRPAWIDDGTTYQDMIDAWNWVGGNLPPLGWTQVFFWSNIGHGSQPQSVYDYIVDFYGETPQPGKPYPFDMPQYFVSDIKTQYEYFAAENEPDGLPYFEVTATEMVGDLSVVLNNKPLPLEDVKYAGVNDEPRYAYKFTLDAVDVDQLSIMNNSVRFLWSGNLHFFSAGVTTGGLSNSMPIPEPSILTLLALGTLVLLLHRRRS